MTIRFIITGLLVLATIGLTPVEAQTLSREEAIVTAAKAVLDETMALPVRQIPAFLLSDAQGVAIVPGVVKGGLVIGVRHGRGVMVIRNEDGSWTGPAFLTLTGGSVGWQIGIQSTDVILVFRTRESVNELLRGKFTIGADASVAAGPIGRKASAATDASLKSEILSYSKSRGLFAGVSLDGTALEIDPVANAAYYQPVVAADGTSQPAVPASAFQLVNTLMRYATVPEVVGTPTDGLPKATMDAAMPDATTTRNALLEPTPVNETTPTPVTKSVPHSESLRIAIAQLSTRLQTGLSEGWKKYLALPEEIYKPASGKMDPGYLKSVIARFDKVAADSRYRVLSEREEFKQMRQFLQEYLEVRPAESQIQLPPPPSTPAGSS
ncbi:MAG: lipid-binding SYLF domain-containing protein [Planctomycetales bacterium]